MVKYDTPTDGISRKQFDRAMDSHIRRYIIVKQEVADLQKAVSHLQKRLHESVRFVEPTAEESPL